MTRGESTIPHSLAIAVSFDDNSLIDNDSYFRGRKTPRIEIHFLGVQAPYPSPSTPTQLLFIGVDEVIAAAVEEAILLSMLAHRWSITVL